MDFPMLTHDEMPFALRAWAVARADGALNHTELRLSRSLRRFTWIS